MSDLYEDYVARCAASGSPTNWTREQFYLMFTKKPGVYTVTMPNAKVAEVDPNGINQHQPGAKLDNGKPRPSLIVDSMSRAIQGVVLVGTFGARKYSDGGWLEVERGIDRYRDAQLRHEAKIAQGEIVDPESGLPHDFHRAWNVLAQVELKARRGDYNVEQE